ncbi:PEPxxWA-CTERM sorting domain-containing protein [Phenylobacterium sp.]|uniref:PEPxxWA-CTERM sorting domain-containing protein n=1 Tax=Phenylobacterium sp. TaxID=1871053 RepID=UPI0025F107F7|nr:PEPxxWA-CTERM sorting domain-containing protein [Phenylobacterium sp.]MBX3482693.1 PEPxxWA-CTERM sorting domain-containing protein [Phenylobacterium sp.]MCW5760610.1 PEPxxWA-CTERM sorting domain-containing protein [Phenylobacterium sp.]
MRSLLLAAALAVTAAPAGAAELLTNGDFSAGATGFNSTYAYGGAGSTFQGNYWVVSNPATVCAACFPAIGDHTSGQGNMMVVDGAGSGDFFWEVVVSVVPYTHYDLSLWATSLGNMGSTPNVTIQINGQQLAAVVLPNTTGVTSTTWNPISTGWFAGAATQATIRLIDTNNVYAFNDLAIDDISFRGEAVTPPGGGIPEPSAWALMILGFGASGAALRRRRGGRRRRRVERNCLSAGAPRRRDRRHPFGSSRISTVPPASKTGLPGRSLRASARLSAVTRT